ncbi:unnamed protein product [Arctogadus glacialis]
MKGHQPVRSTVGKEAVQEQQEVKSQGKVTVMDGTSEGALGSRGAERDSNVLSIRPFIHPSIFLICAHAGSPHWSLETVGAGPGDPLNDQQVWNVPEVNACVQ